MTKVKRITVNVPEDLHHKVKVKSALVGKPISDVVREYLAQWVEDDPSDEVEESQEKS